MVSETKNHTNINSQNIKWLTLKIRRINNSICYKKNEVLKCVTTRMNLENTMLSATKSQISYGEYLEKENLYSWAWLLGLEGVEIKSGCQWI